MAYRGAWRLAIYVANFLAYAAAQDEVLFIPRNFSGVGNNVAFPDWGAVGTTQIRSVVGAEYADADFTPPGGTRPTAREVLTDVFLASRPAVSTKSALFVAWGQLLAFDLSLIATNSSEPFDIPCNDGDGMVDVWCPLGAASEDISFNRSHASVSDSVRSPVNYATSYIDLDFVYGRSEDEAKALRSFEDGLMNITDTGVPFRNDDGTWLVADQRPATFPVTFALHIVLLLEHNRCCIDVAPGMNYEGDEDIYQACRGWTIAVFQHITENDFLIDLLGGSYTDLLIIDSSDTSSSSFAVVGNDDEPSENEEERRKLSASRSSDRYLGRGSRVNQAQRGLGGPVHDNSASEGEPFELVSAGGNQSEMATANDIYGTVASIPSHRRRTLYTLDDYNDTVNAAADVFTTTAGAAAFESALPATLRIVSEGYLSTNYDHIELTVASQDIPELFKNNDVGDILRGALLSPVLAVDAYFTSAVSNTSPLFKLPIDAVQRCRDHGLPNYNTAREAFGLTAATTFSDISSDTDVAALLSAAYGGDIDNLDAFTGALAESSDSSTGGIFGELLHAAWVDQMYRAIAGDRFHHLHSREIEDAQLSTLSDLISRTVNVTDLPLSAFQAATVSVCGGDCASEDVSSVTLSDSYTMTWEVLDDGMLEISLSAYGIGDAGMLGIGWGGLTMSTAQDYIICEVLSSDEAECIDRAPTGSRSIPTPDSVDPDLEVTDVTVSGGWTTVTFLTAQAALDKEDYDLEQDIESEADTSIIYAFREGAGIGQHPNANRGAATINFVTGGVESECEDNDFVSLHGALMLIAWMLIAPLGIYYIRYRKGDDIKWAGRDWYEMHEEIMIVASEAVLPLGITAVFASGGNHSTAHARWGYYMIAAVGMQIFTGWIRTKGLEAKHANFSFLHRCNKAFHIWAGRFAYLAGVVQCYRGLELVTSSDQLVFSAGDGLDLQLGSFGSVRNYVFPAWFALIALCFVFFETRKQYRRYFKKGAANVCGCVQVVNEEHECSDGTVSQKRLMPRTQDLPIYSIEEFNDKVLNGQSWVLADGAVLDVSSFSQRHPGGARLVLNAVGTDVTHELLGEELSVGHAMSFSPHVHDESAWRIARSLVIGYIDEDDDDDEGDAPDRGVGQKGKAGDETRPRSCENNATLRIAGKAVLLAETRLPLGNDNLATTAKRLNALATIPDPAPETGDRSGVTPMRHLPKRTMTSSKRLLEQFHVCPLLFREKMGTAGAVGRGFLPCKRPVYRYIFSCPGQAQVLVKSITGVCYFNMRGQEGGKGVIQRAYNAFAVRVQDTQPPTPGGGVRGGGGTGAGTRTIIPAGQTTQGMLCVEMRIRMYHDGAMSKLLERLAKDTDNPAVQLQGPFVIHKLVPPPAHRNVVMIAAGTGINPMVQQIRDYLALPRVGIRSSRSRLALLWSNTSEADLYGADEITAMQAKSDGLLEVTVVLSGDHRRRNVPGAAFLKAKDRLVANVRTLISPGFSTTSSVMKPTSGRLQESGAIDGSAKSGAELSRHSSSGPALTKEDSSDSKEAGVPRSTSRSNWRFKPSLGSVTPMESWASGSVSSFLSADGWDTGGSLIRGKVTRKVLERVFGKTLLATVAAHSTMSRSKSGGDGYRGGSEAKEDSGGTVIGGGVLDELVGGNDNAGKLQVVVSGPRGFVFHVETVLAEMGIPSGAILFLD